MTSLLRFLLICLTYLSNATTHAYSVIFERNFNDLSVQCASDPTFYWKHVSQTPATDCYNGCHFTPSLAPASLFYVADSYYTFVFRIPQSIAYSYIGIDITFIANQLQISLTLTGSSTIQTPNPPELVVKGFEGEQISCPQGTGWLYAARVVSQTNIGSLEGSLIAQRISPSQLMGIRSLRLWVNCTPNCSACASSTTCETCHADFPMHAITIASTTYSSCELIDACTHGCAQCYNIPTQPSICVKCQAGYTLNIINSTCSQNPFILNNLPCVPSTQYVDSTGSCSNYATLAFYQDRLTTSILINWLPVTSFDPSKYKCQTNELVLIYDLYTYGLFRCGCVIPNCIGCTSLATCNTCNYGFYLDASLTICIPAEIVNCAIVIPIVSANLAFQCTTCKAGYHFNEHALICTEDSLSILFFTQKSQKVLPDGIIITLQSNQPIQTYAGQQYQDVLHVNLVSGITEFTQTIMEITNNTIKLKLTPSTTIKQDTAILLFTDTYFNSINSLQSTQYSLTLLDFFYLSEGQKSASETATYAGTVMSVVLLVAMAPIVVISNFYFIINTIDLTGFLYYSLFIPVRYPSNMLSFYGLFYDFQFPFIPNFFADLIDPNYVQAADTPFTQNGVQLYFLSNSGQSLSIACFILGTYILAKILSHVSIPLLSKYLLNAIDRTWEYNALFDLLWTLYIYLIIGTFLQFQSYEFSETYFLLNYALHSIVAFVVLIFPYFVCRILSREKHIKSNKQFRKKFDSLFNGQILFDESEIDQCTCEEQQANEKQHQQQLPARIHLTSSQHQEQQEQLQFDDSPVSPCLYDSTPQTKPSKKRYISNKFSDSIIIPPGTATTTTCNNDFIVNDITLINPGSDDVTNSRHSPDTTYPASSSDPRESHIPSCTCRHNIRQYLRRRFSKMYVGILYWRKLIFALVIVYLTAHPYLQLLATGTLNLCILVFLLYIHPLESRRENIKNSVGEAILLAISITTSFLVEDRKDELEEDRLFLGWIIIGLSGFILAWHTFELLINSLKLLFTFIKGIFRCAGIICRSIAVTIAAIAAEERYQKTPKITEEVNSVSTTGSPPRRMSKWNTKAAAAATTTITTATTGRTKRGINSIVSNIHSNSIALASSDTPRRTRRVVQSDELTMTTLKIHNLDSTAISIVSSKQKLIGGSKQELIKSQSQSASPGMHEQSSSVSWIQKFRLKNEQEHSIFMQQIQSQQQQQQQQSQNEQDYSFQTSQQLHHQSHFNLQALQLQHQLSQQVSSSTVANDENEKDSSPNLSAPSRRKRRSLFLQRKKFQLSDFSKQFSAS